MKQSELSNKVLTLSFEEERIVVEVVLDETQPLTRLLARPLDEDIQ